MGIIWTIIIGFLAGIIAKVLMPGDNEPSGFILTTILGIVGAFVASYLGQALGWYAPGEGAGLIGAAVGAIIVLAVSGDTPESMLQRLQRALGRFNKDGVLPDPLSFSVGSVGCRPQDELSLKEQLAAADAPIYHQKQEHKKAPAAPNRGA